MSILEKRNLKDQKFAFVRMFGEAATSRAIQGSNGSWIGERKIVSQRARYEKERNISKDSRQAQPKMRIANPPLVFGGRTSNSTLAGNRSWTEVLGSSG